MSNDNFVAAFQGFDTGGPFCFRSAGPGDFNSVDSQGTFGAAVTAIVRGEFVNNNVVPQYLWGNRDPAAPNLGWSIEITLNAVTGQAEITGFIGRGAAVESVVFPLTGAGTPAWAERLMQIGLFLTAGPTAVLTINGTVVAESLVLATPFAASGLPVSLGCSPETPPQIDADTVDIVAAHHTYNLTFGNATAVGRWASKAFAAERGACGGSPALETDLGIPWIHAYSARVSGQNQIATIRKLPTSAGLVTQNLPRPNGYPTAPLTLVDIGNQLAATDPDLVGDEVTPVNYNPINLTNPGAPFQGIVPFPYIVGRKNVDWYSGGSYAFALA